jgi:glycosyltransferase involved in cell wall biosynthesis
MDRIPVSVIVASFNSIQWLKQCIESINAGIKPMEIVVVDDCSTDGSLLVAHELSRVHSNVRVLQTRINNGAAEARKIGFIAAVYDFVAIVDADDIIEMDALLDAYSKFSEDVDICIWKLWRFDGTGNQWEMNVNQSVLPINGEQAALLTLGSWNIHPLGIARKSLYLNAYQDFTIKSFNADELISRIILKNARKIVGSNKRYFYRLNPESTTQKIDLKHLTLLRTNVWLINFAISTKGAPVDQMVWHTISSAYNIWRMRRLFGWLSVKNEIKIMIRSLLLIKVVWWHLLKRPKYLLFFIFIILATIAGP